MVNDKFVVSLVSATLLIGAVYGVQEDNRVYKAQAHEVNQEQFNNFRKNRTELLQKVASALEEDATEKVEKKIKKITKSETELTELVQEVREERLEREREEEEARIRAEEEAQRQAEAENNKSSVQTTSEPAKQQSTPQDNVWHVPYHRTYGALSAPADGSVAEWAQGWFIAHRGMWGGEMIASCPEYVEVDGRLYKFSYSEVEDDEIWPNEVERARANGGIMFQTCITETTNLMTHYLPVGAGYPYTWESYPYVTTDAEYIGYWR